MHGLNDGQAILGSLNHPWTAKVQRPGDMLRFENYETGEVTLSDPRLPLLGEEWKMTPLGKFFNHETGEMSEMDPRCNLETLHERVQLREMLIR